MIHLQAKQFQVVVWRDEDRQSEEPALRLDFDTLEEAKTALMAHQAEGLYRAGVLMEWHNQSGIWDLIEYYP